MLNKMLAACGVGKGYYKPGQEPYTFTNHNHFFRLKGIGYNRLSRHKDSEGLVSLILNTPASQIKSTERTKVGFFFNFITYFYPELPFLSKKL